MSTRDIAKNERIISINKNFMTKFHELREQPTYAGDFDFSDLDRTPTMDMLAILISLS